MISDQLFELRLVFQHPSVDMIREAEKLNQLSSVQSSQLAVVTHELLKDRKSGDFIVIYSDQDEPC